MIRFSICLIVILLSNPVSSQTDEITLSEKYKIAIDNKKTIAGNEFDRSLANAMERKKNLREEISYCLNEKKGERTVLGVYEFLDKTKEYQVHLMPESDFSKCLELALEGETLPRPTSYPYYSPFDFSTTN